MNQTQRKYALERIQGIYKEKAADLKKHCDISPAPITHGELQKQIKSGAVKVIRPKSELYKYADVKDVFDLPDGLFEQDEMFDGTYEGRKKKLDAYFMKIKDELMLGDAEEAVKLIKAFDSEKF